MGRNDPGFTTSLAAGAAAGTAVDITLFPLDTIKTRIQSEVGFLAAGGFRGIYNGLGPAALASAPNAAAFFCTYESMKKYLLHHIGRDYEAGIHMAAAGAGEVVACIIRVPMEIVKQRRQAQIYDSSLQVVKDTLRKEGLRGLYRGYFSTVAREIPFSFIQFPLWELFKKLWSQKQGCYVDSWQAALCGAGAGGIAAALTTPLDVAKTRIMLAESGSHIAKGSIMNALVAVYTQHGIKGVFSGIVPRTMWISIGGSIFFGVYEKSKYLISMYIR